MTIPEKIRALIVDDESLARDKIRQLLLELPHLELIGECSNGLEAVEWIGTQKPDLVFLDIQMPGLDGFGVIRAVGIQEMPTVIFVTAYDQYAIQAFEHHALDYLLKPFNARRFHSAVERAVGFLHQPGQDLNQRLRELMEQLKDSGSYIERIMIKTAHRMYFIKVDEIDWIEAAGNYLEIHTGAQSHLLRETMNNLETKLNPSRFLRIHRSVIVNIEQIQEMQPDVDHDYIVILKSGKQLMMSRRQRDKLNRLIGPYL